MLYLKFLCINEMLAVVVAISRRRRRRFGGIIDAGALASPLSTTISCRS
jgi:hypothetical protein